MPPAYVKPYVKRRNNDPADAEAIREAVIRRTMRFVETKTPEQRSCLMLHRTRHLLIWRQTAAINAVRAHLAEFGIVAPVGRNGVVDFLDIVADSSDRPGSRSYESTSTRAIAAITIRASSGSGSPARCAAPRRRSSAR